MEFKDREFIPVLLGGDINTYSVARAFYEQYQVKTYIFGKFATGPSYGRSSNIIRIRRLIRTIIFFRQSMDLQKSIKTKRLCSSDVVTVMWR